MGRRQPCGAEPALRRTAPVAAPAAAEYVSRSDECGQPHLPPAPLDAADSGELLLVRSPGQHVERRGSLLGRAGATTKRLYYIDWPLLDRHRETLAPRIDRWLDLRDSRNPASLNGSSLRRTAAELTTRPFRTRPTFNSKSWDGHWAQRTLGMNPGARNTAFG